MVLNVPDCASQIVYETVRLAGPQGPDSIRVLFHLLFMYQRSIGKLSSRHNKIPLRYGGCLMRLVVSTIPYLAFHLGTTGALV